jgi:hypothetical protein
MTPQMQDLVLLLQQTFLLTGRQLLVYINLVVQSVEVALKIIDAQLNSVSGLLDDRWSYIISFSFLLILTAWGGRIENHRS